MTNTITRTIFLAAKAAVLIGLAALAPPDAAAQEQGGSPIAGTWMISINGAKHSPATLGGIEIDTSTPFLIMAETTIPQNACTSGPVDLGAGHGSWRFRRQNGRLRWTTVNKLTGQEAWVIATSGVAQPGPGGRPVFNGVARITTYLDANALQQDTPSCTTQVSVSGFHAGR